MVASIGEGAFRDCTNLTSISIPDIVEHPNKAFSHYKIDLSQEMKV